jgi:hypothetical protein
MNQLKIEIGDTVRIVDTSRYYGMWASNPSCDGVLTDISYEGDCDHPYRVEWCNGEYNFYNLHDLTLIKKGKTVQFTKSDLKTGMFVKQRNGMFLLVLEKAAVGNTWFTNLSDLKENLLADYKHLDIVAVYEAAYGGIVKGYMRGESLTPIWERTEQTEAQKEMEVLQEQAKALQEQITKLQSKL